MPDFPSELTKSFGAVSDQGAAFDDEDSPKNEYYGFLAEIEQVKTKNEAAPQWSVQFELVPVEWMETAVLASKKDLKSQPPRSPATLLVFDDATPDAIAKALGTLAKEIAEGGWYIITLGKGLPARRAKPAPGSKYKKVRAKGTKVDKARTRILVRRFRPRGKWSVKRIMQMLAAFFPRVVGVMDVGQASCNLIYDDNGLQQFYVDIGLPLFPNLGSIPPPVAGHSPVVDPGPCQHHNPPIIMTHWHWDHYSMALMAANHAQLCARDWISSVQPIGGVGNNLVLAVNGGGGAMHPFPPGLPGLLGGFVQIIPCAPPAAPPLALNNLNNNGIAVVVTVDDANGRRVLLPGDAAYQAIPGVNAVGGLRWMPATHHGSDTDLSQAVIPAPEIAGQGRLAYSYGIVGGPPGGWHCYGHPVAAGVADYNHAGWGNGARVASTAETAPNSNVAGRGNIMLVNNVNPQNCGVAHCPFHNFPKTLI